MIALFRGKYKLQDYEYLKQILDKVLIHHTMCDSVCSACDKITACEDLYRLRNYVHKVIAEEKNSSNR